MTKQKIEVEGIKISSHRIEEDDYFSLTDIAKKFNEKPSNLLIAWMKNRNTILFLEAWEKRHNPNFNVRQMANFKLAWMENRNIMTPKKWIEETGAIGIINKLGRYGGAFAHKDIILNFCYWVSPPFQVEMIIKFQELMEAEFQRQNLKWHLSKITDNIDEVRNLLDTIPHQDSKYNRLKKGE